MLIALVDLLEGGLVSFLAKPIVRSDVMGFLEELLLTGFFKESLNTIFLMQRCINLLSEKPLPRGYLYKEDGEGIG